MKKNKICIILCIVIFIAIGGANISGTGWIIYHDGPYRGKVVNADTELPLEGAAVAAMWRLKTYGGPGGPVGVYCDARETLTDRNGEFTIPKAFCINLWPFTTMDFPELVIFKPGYLGYPPIGFTPEERSNNLPGFSGSEFRDKGQCDTVRLGLPKTRRERESTLHQAESLIHDETQNKLLFLVKLINAENKNLGIGEWPQTGGKK